eukprot:TRINITY_DN6703_c0_g1_i1.p2 TRINITY_DN6703_c0_g1~~TRINITY_DN6703_c0_g1_i1.p2  ORF type:complete len:148 (-),score=34.43 TRINITY_DN6703_c0_g1_i1:494-937(-)
MARYFKEQDIDEYRECFYLYSRRGFLTTDEDLGLIMRSLGMSPTIHELRDYMKSKAGKVNFADFLEIVHRHSSKENAPKEILDAFQDMDVDKRKNMSEKDLRHILMRWGERLTAQEVDRVFREASVGSTGRVHYEDFVRVVSSRHHL